MPRTAERAEKPCDTCRQVGVFVYRCKLAGGWAWRCSVCRTAIGGSPCLPDPVDSTAEGKRRMTDD